MFFLGTSLFFFGTTPFVSEAFDAVEAQDGFSVAEQYSFPMNVGERRKLEPAGGCFSEFTYTNAEDWNTLGLDNVDCESSCDATTAQSPLNYDNGDRRPHEDFDTSTHQLKIQWDPTPFRAKKDEVKSICPTGANAADKIAKLEKACSFPNAFSLATCICGGKPWWQGPSSGAAMSQKYSCNNCNNMKVVLTAPGFKESTFQLAQFHMHVPSENTVNGKHATAEIHFVHVSLSEGTPHYLVVGIFLEVTLVEKEVSPFAKNLFKDDLGFQVLGRADMNKADWESLWTSKTDAPLKGHFWHNQGSLTTPPCTEAVEWFVLETPLKVTYEMITAYQTILERNKETPHTARPTQNKNNKSTIYYGSLKTGEDYIEGIPPPSRRCPVAKSSAFRTTTSLLLGLFALLWL